MAKEMLNNDLPLHIALFVHAPDDIIIALYQVYPDGAKIKSSKGKTAIQIAVDTKRSDVVQDILCGRRQPAAATTGRTMNDKHSIAELERKMRTSLDDCLVKAFSQRSVMMKVKTMN
eukprot:CAMPEP_0116034102 /NCGR_PEP_ID=MMETSP0321-20121206/19399_1 /TAXON_ID=163516 /ORGANISM="Leptocylindrus danicus var. danicus, Strain B650" /LENGTH=116 /DNA_ID=CAMNT_0003510333 /DNA_START=187 /DNA_END=537 /DNA_ORIENTATION=+